MRLVADILADLGGEPVDQGAGVGAGSNGCTSGEREELPGLVARLREPVGVEQDRLASLPGDGERDTRNSGERAQAEGKAAVRGSQEIRALGAEPQRPRVAAVEHHHLAAVFAHIREDGGDELLVAELAQQCGFDPGGDRAERALLVGGHAESAHRRRGLLHRGQALAFRIPDDQPDAPRHGYHRVQIPANPRPGRGGKVPGAQPDRADSIRHRAQEHLLGDIGDRADLQQLPLPAAADVTRQRTPDGDADDGKQRDPELLGTGGRLRFSGEQRLLGKRHCADGHGVQHPAERRRGGWTHGQQRKQSMTRPHQQPRDSHQEEDRERDSQQRPIPPGRRRRPIPPDFDSYSPTPPITLMSRPRTPHDHAADPLHACIPSLHTIDPLARSASAEPPPPSGSRLRHVPAKRGG